MSDPIDRCNHRLDALRPVRERLSVRQPSKTRAAHHALAVWLAVRIQPCEVWLDEIDPCSFFEVIPGAERPTVAGYDRNPEIGLVVVVLEDAR